MTDSRIAREEAERIAKLLGLYPDEHTIEAILAYGRRERAQGMREAAEIARPLPNPILMMWERPGGPPGNGYVPLTGAIVAEAIEHRARETEEGKNT